MCENPAQIMDRKISKYLKADVGNGLFELKKKMTINNHIQLCHVLIYIKQQYILLILVYKKLKNPSRYIKI